METQKNLVLVLGEWLEARRVSSSNEIPSSSARQPGWLQWLGSQLIPNLGSVLLVLVLLSVFPSLAAPNQSPAATSISTIPYQGRLADSGGTPVTGMQNMEFRIYDVPTGGVPLWEEFWTGGNAVSVSDGLFSVLLGSLNTGLATVVQGHDELYLGVTVGTDTEMSPRVQLGSVPFSMQALTVPDGSITTAKIADGAITHEKAPTLIRDLVNNNTAIQYGIEADVREQIWVSFPHPFTTIPYVFITQREVAGGFANYIVHAVSTTGFYILPVGTSNYGYVDWLAIGK